MTVDEDICGFRIDLREWVLRPDYFSSAENWKREPREYYCYCRRGTWPGHDRCIWHAEVADKPPDEFVKMKNEGNEKLEGAILRGTDLGDTISFAGCTLIGSDLTQANLLGANLSEVPFRNANLEATNLRIADLSEASFRETNLHNVMMGSADLTDTLSLNADFTQANLGGTDFTEAHLVDTDFTGVVAKEAEFSNATLRYSDFSNAVLDGTDFLNSYHNSTFFKDSILHDADFTQATLRDVDLTDADLHRADLTDADLGGVNLTRVFLEDALLESSDLDAADLTDAKLHNCRLQDVYLSNETTFGERCAYERAADPNDLLPWDIIGPSMESVTITLDDHHVYQGSPLSAAFTRFQYWTRTISGWTPDTKDLENLDKAISVYRTYQRLHRENSLPGDIPHYFYREKEMRRTKALAEGNHLEWASRALQRWVMGYGERPWRVVGTSVVVILVCAILYPLLGGVAVDHSGTTLTVFEPLDTPLDELPGGTWLASLYFSLVTFTTLGYGDIQPASAPAQYLAGIESLVGAALLALLVAVLARRVTR